jgi:hypothetical protein
VAKPATGISVLSSAVRAVQDLQPPQRIRRSQAGPRGLQDRHGITLIM